MRGDNPPESQFHFPGQSDQHGQSDWHVWDFQPGLGLVIITGGIDLSVVSMIALCGVLLSMALTEWHWPWTLAAAAAVLLPMLLGWIRWRRSPG